MRNTEYTVEKIKNETNTIVPHAYMVDDFQLDEAYRSQFFPSVLILIEYWRDIDGSSRESTGASANSAPYRARLRYVIMRNVI